MGNPRTKEKYDVMWAASQEMRAAIKLVLQEADPPEWAINLADALDFADRGIQGSLFMLHPSTQV